MIDLNITLLIQLVNFIIALVGINYLLVRPIRRIVKQRRELAAGLLQDAENFTANAKEKLESYEAALARAREEASKEREREKAEAHRREGEILSAAQAQAASFLQETRETTRAAIEEAMQELSRRIPALAAEAAANLSRAGSSSGRGGHNNKVGR